MKEINIKINTIKYGQPRPYADSEYEYEVEVKGMSEFEVKMYCNYVLLHCNQTFNKWEKENANSYFHGYYSFSKIDENKYKYYVKKPYTG